MCPQQPFLSGTGSARPGAGWIQHPLSPFELSSAFLHSIVHEILKKRKGMKAESGQLVKGTSMKEKGDK
jgi:hypothetical protein